MGCGSSSKTKHAQEPKLSKTNNPASQVTPSNPPAGPVKAKQEENKISPFTIGSYSVTSLKTKLPYSNLYNSTHITANLPRSLKVVDIEPSSEVSLNPKHLERETNQLKSLDHVNIVKIFDMFPSNNKFCIAMENLNGVNTLLQFISSLNGFKENQVARIVSQLLSAVAYCHSKQVIHRDLNPKLIYVLSYETLDIKVAEFGSSAFMDPENKLIGKSFDRIYTAPEVFEGYYNEKCDVWSVGVIMHLLLVGSLPQNELDESKLTEVNDSAKDLLKKLMNKDFKLRLSAAEALSHPWIQSVNDANSADIKIVLNSLKGYSKFSEAQDAVREFIAGQIVSYNDSQYFIENFRKLDSNNDGKITKDELHKHYITLMPEEEAKKTVQEIFEAADRNKNGSIEFAEFVQASMKKSSILSIENIEKAFKLLDKDNSNQLSIEELQFLLGDTADKAIRRLVAEADTNGDGQISFSEFLELLKKKYNS